MLKSRIRSAYHVYAFGQRFRVNAVILPINRLSVQHSILGEQFLIYALYEGEDAINPETISLDSSLISRRVTTAIRSVRRVFIITSVLRRIEQAIRRAESILTTGNVVENSGSVASNDRINSAGLPDARSLCVPA